MKQNVHNIERVVRVIVGLAIISLVFIGPQSIWGWLGLIPLSAIGESRHLTQDCRNRLAALHS
jgi:hypothetical protein